VTRCLDEDIPGVDAVEVIVPGRTWEPWVPGGDLGVAWTAESIFLTETSLEAGMAVGAEVARRRTWRVRPLPKNSSSLTCLVRTSLWGVYR